MRRVLVIGSSGSGKTTLATRLAEKFSLPLVFLDVHYWRPGWKPPDAAAWRQRVGMLVDNPEWVMDGNFSETFDLRMPRADTLVWLDFPRAICLRRVLMRTILYYGRRRPDLPEGCPEQFDAKLLRWLWDFPVNSRPAIVAGLDRFGLHLNVVQLRNDRHVGEFLRAQGIS